MAPAKLTHPPTPMPILAPVTAPSSHAFPLKAKPTADNYNTMKFRSTIVRSSSSSSFLPSSVKDADPQVKHHLFAQLQGINRGIFGTPSEKKAEILQLVELLEAENPTPNPTLCLEKVGGAWKLVYSTITILGSRRTKLGLRDFITLGDFIQSIDVAQGKAVNIIKFSAKGLSLLNGQLTIEASFKIASKSRVDITYCKSEITPDQLMNVFRKNYHLLLGIFNPEGWLEITYVDDGLRIGRDNKGNVFILERVENQTPPPTS